jgi:hypothetical protein
VKVTLAATRTQAPLPAAGNSAATFRKLAVPAPHAANAGYSVRGMLAGGYPAAPTLRACGELCEVQLAHLAPQDVVAAGELYGYDAGLTGVAGAAAMVRAGWSTRDVRVSGLVDVRALAAAGIGPEQLREAGYSDEALQTACLAPRAPTAAPGATLPPLRPHMQRVQSAL